MDYSLRLKELQRRSGKSDHQIALEIGIRVEAWRRMCGGDATKLPKDMAMWWFRVSQLAIVLGATYEELLNENSLTKGRSMKDTCLKKIISGGQTGADYGGLLAGEFLSLETGGTAPKGWRIQNFDGNRSSNPGLAKFGLVEHESDAYPPRTKQNVLDSDGTVWFGYEESGGGKLTIGTCLKHKKPCLINPVPGQLLAWVEANHIETLNVAGNRLSKFNPDIEKMTYEFLVKEFCYEQKLA